jgi:hypothetical protein
MRKPNEFLKVVKAKKAQLCSQLKDNVEMTEANTLIARIELLNMVIWEFGNKVHNNSLKNLGHRNKF